MNTIFGNWTFRTFHFISLQIISDSYLLYIGIDKTLRKVFLIENITNHMEVFTLNCLQFDYEL